MRHLLSLFVFSASAVAQQATQPAAMAAAKIPEKPKYEIANLYLSATRMIMMLRVGTNAPVPVVFDTGTNGNLIDLELADRMKLPNTGPSPSIDGDTGKPVPGHDTFIAGAKLGGLAIADARATAFAYNLTDEVGIFGPNSFPNKLVRINGPKSLLATIPITPETVPNCTAFPYLKSEGSGLPSAVLDFGDQKITAILDTGNDAPIILPMEYIKKLQLTGQPEQIGFAVSAAGKQPILSSHLKGTLKIGGVSIDAPEIRFMEGGHPNVGFPILRNLILVMDPTGQRDWVFPPGTPSGRCTPA